MSASVTTLLAAIAAVIGTLTAPILTQRFANKARQQEIQASRRERIDDREAAEGRAYLLDRRQSYTALHTAAWDFRRALKNCVFDEDASDELEEARQAFLATYRNMQLIGTDSVLRAAAPVYDQLTDTYGIVKKLVVASRGVHDSALPSMTRAEAQDGLTSVVEDSITRAAVRDALNSVVEDSIRHMRKAMRVDLGVSEPDGPAGSRMVDRPE